MEGCPLECRRAERGKGQLATLDEVGAALDRLWTVR